MKGEKGASAMGDGKELARPGGAGAPAGPVAGAASAVDLGNLQDFLFGELNNLMGVDASDPDALEREVTRASAVASLAGVAIDNANTVLRVVQVRDALQDRTRKMPRMLGAGA